MKALLVVLLSFCIFSCAPIATTFRESTGLLTLTKVVAGKEAAQFTGTAFSIAPKKLITARTCLFVGAKR